MGHEEDEFDNLTMKETDRSHPKAVAEDTNFANHATKNRRLEESEINLLYVASKCLQQRKIAHV